MTVPIIDPNKLLFVHGSDIGYPSVTAWDLLTWQGGVPLPVTKEHKQWNDKIGKRRCSTKPYSQHEHELILSVFEANIDLINTLTARLSAVRGADASDCRAVLIAVVLNLCACVWGWLWCVACGPAVRLLL